MRGNATHHPALYNYSETYVMLISGLELVFIGLITHMKVNNKQILSAHANVYTVGFEFIQNPSVSANFILSSREMG